MFTKWVAGAAVVLAALFALSSFAVADADAANFTSEKSPTFWQGEQVETNVFTFAGGSFKCTKSSFSSGEIVGLAAAAVEVSPAISGCTFFGQSAEWAFNGCKFRFAAETASSGPLSIVCPSGQAIVITLKAAGCSWKIGAQTPKAPTVDFSNQGTGATRDIQFRYTVGGLTYTSTGGVCGSSGTNGTITGSVTVKGYSNASHTVQQGISVD